MDLYIFHCIKRYIISTRESHSPAFVNNLWIFIALRWILTYIILFKFHYSITFLGTLLWVGFTELSGRILKLNIFLPVCTCTHTFIWSIRSAKVDERLLTRANMMKKWFLKLILAIRGALRFFFGLPLSNNKCALRIHCDGTISHLKKGIKTDSNFSVSAIIECGLPVLFNNWNKIN